jgi:hypothetical protein
MSDDTLSVFLNMNGNFHALLIELNLGGCNYELFKKEFSHRIHLDYTTPTYLKNMEW